MTILAGILCGAVLFLAFRRSADRTAIGQWKRKRRAYVMGLYLFGDDPVVSLRGLAQIARANAMLLLHALPALAWAAPVVAGAAFALDRYEARSELTNPAVVTAHWTASCEPRLETDLPITSPPVHIATLHEVSWRVAAHPGASPPRAGCNGKWVSTRMESAAPSELWILWFGLVAWATSWLLSVAGRLFRFRA